MSMFPSVGSTVTKVLANKSGTVAKVEFDDGTSLLVRYEALVIDSSESEDSTPVRQESRVMMTGGAKVRQHQVPAKSAKQVAPQKSSSPMMMSEAAYKELASKALKRQESRQEQLFKQWEKDTGQFDHAAGPMQ